jgi:predicted transglutaminase-like cysteine proteinase
LARDAAKFARVHDASLPPFGYVQFCVSRPKQCRSDGRTFSRVKATAARLAELDFINRSVNKAIKPAEFDLPGWKRPAFTLPTKAMTCASSKTTLVIAIQSIPSATRALHQAQQLYDGQ